ncbi:MAG: DUF296 domain-containing protein [bacterium]|nr:DUF296 domain-containing protein [bacterium]
MKLVLKDGRRYVLRFDFGEEFIETFKRFCAGEKIASGFFSGLGAASEVTLGFFDLETKKYLENKFVENLEIASLTGNISKNEGDLVIHTHSVLGRNNNNYESLAGHVKNLVVSAALEIHLIALDDPLERKFDSKTGLNLLN